MLAFIIATLIGGFVVGGLARFAVPGPDPMPLWLTTAIGIAGSIIAGVVTRALTHSTSASFPVALLAAVGLVIAYRRFVQHRPITGAGAQASPPRPSGLRDMFGGASQGDSSADNLRKLAELRDAGVLTQEEYEAKRQALLSRP